MPQWAKQNLSVILFSSWQSAFSSEKDTRLADKFDIVVAGAGHNSLVTAAYLSKAGYRCLILEGHAVIGGGARCEELTLPGYKHDSFATAHVITQNSPTLLNDELSLGEYGLEYIFPDPVAHIAFDDGSYMTQWRDFDRTCGEFAKFSRRDAEAYRRMMSEFDSVKSIFNEARFTPVGFGKPLNELLAAHPDGKLWQRRQAMSSWEIIRDNFEDEHTRCFMLWFAMLNVVPADQPMTGRLAYALINERQRWSWCIPKGGSQALPDALARVVESHGGAILTSKRITRLILDNGRCTGVACSDGTEYHAEKAVLSTIHVKHLVEMAPSEAWGRDFLQGAESYQGGPSLFVAHYATSEPPQFPVSGGHIAPVAGGTMASVKRALKVGYNYSVGAVDLEDPPLLVLCPTVADSSRTPPGKHTLKVIDFQPYDLPEGPEHWDKIKNEVAAANLKYLQRFAPNLTDDKILAKRIESPLDLERANLMAWHGSCHGGAQTPSQTAAMRPVPGWAQHRMPIPGLYQTGATTHPGGSVSCGPGRNAAMVMLKDFGTSLEQVLAKNI